jgi:hypothetical protein
MRSNRTHMCRQDLTLNLYVGQLPCLTTLHLNNSPTHANIMATQSLLPARQGRDKVYHTTLHI